MRKSTKKWMIAATALVMIGTVIFSAVMTVYHWDFTKLSTVKTEINIYEIDQSFRCIAVNTDTADIHVLPSDDDQCKVICREPETEAHSVQVSDGTLTVSAPDQKAWYEFIGINFNKTEVTVFLPDIVYANLSVQESTGEITVENLSVENLNFSVSTGKMIISNILCNSFLSTGSTGNVFLKNVNAAEKISIERSTGDVDLNGCDGAEIFVKTDTGDVTGRLLSKKMFFTETSTGSISVPEETGDGKCEVTTSTGNILFRD